MKKEATYVVLIAFVMSHYANAAMESFVVGGAFVKIQHFPHSAFLQVDCDGSWICGSAILNQRILLTAAHCVTGCAFGQENNTMDALMGHSNLEKVSIKRRVIDVVVHKRFNENSLTNDIALAMVREDIPLGDHVKRVVISKTFPKRIRDHIGYVAGWGITSYANSNASSIRLKYTSQKFLPRTSCTVIGEMHKGMFCAGTTDSDGDHPAQGDSGSAMVTKGYHQIGLVSFCLKKYPALSVYTNVSYYYGWISRNSKLLFCKNK